MRDQIRELFPARVQPGTDTTGNLLVTFGHGAEHVVAVNVPLSWPGRYSHSPVEVADLRDIEALVRLITVIAMQ